MESTRITTDQFYLSKRDRFLQTVMCKSGKFSILIFFFLNGKTILLVSGGDSMKHCKPLRRIDLKSSSYQPVFAINQFVWKLENILGNIKISFYKRTPAMSLLSHHRPIRSEFSAFLNTANTLFPADSLIHVSVMNATRTSFSYMLYLLCCRSLQYRSLLFSKPQCHLRFYHLYRKSLSSTFLFRSLIRWLFHLFLFSLHNQAPFLFSLFTNHPNILVSSGIVFY